MSQSDVPVGPGDSVRYCDGVVLKGPEVNMTQIDPKLVKFLNVLGMVHLPLFGLVVVVTSGRDSQHVAGSKHGIGQAVDIRVVDKQIQWRAAFLLVCDVIAEQCRLTIFNESNSPSSPHLHIEVAS
jgi:hypothetical protein